MNRLPGWEDRLAAVFESARATPYVLGQHDCLRVACAAVAALTGVDYWQRFAGGYATQREAIKVIRSIAPDLGRAVSMITGTEPVLPLQARRGDLMLYSDPAGEHLAVCNGATAAVLGPDGLLWLPLDHAGLRAAWRIG